MTVGELHAEAIKGKHHSLKLLIDYLVQEKKVLQMEDDSEKLNYYLQDRFQVKINQYLGAYDEKNTNH